MSLIFETALRPILFEIRRHETYGCHNYDRRRDGDRHALMYDFTNGFHDTANAMATSISAGALKPKTAVIAAGTLNLVGAVIIGAGVAIVLFALWLIIPFFH